MRLLASEICRLLRLVVWKSSHLSDKNGASGKRCDIDGQPERASVWENASQCEELTATFVTILNERRLLSSSLILYPFPLSAVKKAEPKI